MYQKNPDGGHSVKIGRDASRLTGLGPTLRSALRVVLKLEEGTRRDRTAAVPSLAEIE